MATVAELTESEVRAKVEKIIAILLKRGSDDAGAWEEIIEILGVDETTPEKPEKLLEGIRQTLLALLEKEECLSGDQRGAVKEDIEVLFRNLLRGGYRGYEDIKTIQESIRTGRFPLELSEIPTDVYAGITTNDLPQNFKLKLVGDISEAFNRIVADVLGDLGKGLSDYDKMKLKIKLENALEEELRRIGLVEE